MFFNIIIFFIILMILVLIFKYSTDYKEGFFDFPDAIGGTHTSFVKDSQIKFNELTNTINLTNPAIPVSSDTSKTFNDALDGLSATPTVGTYSLSKKTDYSIPSGLPTSFKSAKLCESKPPSCSAFDDPEFATNCGISFDKNGLDMNGKPHIGGMFISAEDKRQQLELANNVLSTGEAPYDPYKVYQPTLGKSKPGTFALTKDQCLIVKERIDCATKQTFNSPNCTQCYTSQRFARVGPETGRIPSTLYLIGSGAITVTTPNAQSNAQINLSTTNLDSQTPIQINIPANAEGTNFNILVEATNITTFVSGFLQGQTPRGTFKLDLFNLVESDIISNSKPKINGSIIFNGFRCMSITPNTGQSAMNLSCLMPFSFLSMYDGDALTCDNGPIITKASSATFLESDPCFGKNNSPGNYSLSCIQERWIELGGTPQGNGYPSNQVKANAIQTDANGRSLDIDTIVNTLAPKFTSALTGKSPSGEQLGLSDWNALSLWATGTPINTPCDGIINKNGPLSQDCLSYLYLNQGINSHIGPTYTLSPSNMASMKGQQIPNTFCQPGTSIDPSTPSGLKFGQSLGGIANVKQTYDQINRLANDNTKSNDARTNAINQCYGIVLDSAM